MPAISVTGESASSRARPAKSRLGGFTLIELMVALMIVVLVTASVPFARSRFLPARRVAAAADRLVADIRWLQTRSIATGVTGRLALLPSGYRLELQRDGSESRDQREVTLPTSTAVRFRAHAEHRPVRELIVYPDGTISSGQFDIEDSGRRAAVQVTMLTGRAVRTS